MPQTTAQKERREEWRRRYLKCSAVDELDVIYDEIRESEGYVFYDFVRDAWTAANFARARGLQGVRLVDERWPDFKLQEYGGEKSYEVIEADIPGRRRDAEYRELVRQQAAGDFSAKHHPFEDWLRPSTAVEMLRKAAELKAGRHYAERVGLVIYLNETEHGAYQPEIEGAMADATKAARHSFETVWVLWKGKAYRIWANGGLGSLSMMVREALK